MTPEQLQEALLQFSGTDHYYTHWLKQFHYTDGVKFLADQAGAHWLIDAIASYQPDVKKSGNVRLNEFQLWELAVEGSRGVLTLREDDGFEPFITQAIEFVDFPLSSIKLYLENQVLCLPRER